MMSLRRSMLRSGRARPSGSGIACGPSGRLVTPAEPADRVSLTALPPPSCGLARDGAEELVRLVQVEQRGVPVQTRPPERECPTQHPGDDRPRLGSGAEQDQ